MAEIGQRIGPFELVEQLGAARGTSLFRATRPERTREPQVVAIRVADRLDHAPSTEAIRVEYEVLKKLDDGHIPAVHGYYPGQAALALDWRDGITLGDLIGSARARWAELDAATALDIAVEVAVALRAAHVVVHEGHPLFHGHLDPSRVRLGTDGEVTVVGFGVSRQDLDPHHCPPELAAGGVPDVHTDQWALGALIVDMLLLHPVYQGLPDVHQAALEGRVGVAVGEVEQRWPSLARSLRKMLAPNPASRLTSDGEVISALLAAGREIGGASSRSACVAAALRQRRILAESAEPALPQRMTLAVVPVSVEEEVTDDEETAGRDDFPPAANQPDANSDTFADGPTRPDGLMPLSAALFTDHPTDPGVQQEAPSASFTPAEISISTEAEPAEPQVSVPAPPAPRRLESSERVAMALGVLLVLVGLAYLLLRWS